MRQLARNVLTVYWNGEEVTGLTFYGIRPRRHVQHVEQLNIRPDFVANAEAFFLTGNEWEAVVWSICITQWPAVSEFPGFIKMILEKLRSQGYVVSWLGRPEHFVDPPDLFLPAHMSGAVLAAITPISGLQIAVDLDEPLVGLSDDDLLRLRSESCGLAEAT